MIIKNKLDNNKKSKSAENLLLNNQRKTIINQMVSS